VVDLAAKNQLLKAKVTILSQKGLESKVLALLENYASREGGGFLVPYSREEMAAYLGADRSALSRLLSQTAKKKLISYEKTFFGS
jgi:CRP/FNR family transcriptional regulator, dissimilatory nitrate respiration regulator